MASETVTGGIGWSRAQGSRRALVRLGLALLSCVAVTTLTSWEWSRLPLAEGIAECAFCVLAWEAAVPLCGTLLRMWRGPAVDGSPLRLVATVFMASVPATLGIVAMFRFVGNPVTVPSATYGQSLLLGLLLAFARRGLTRGGAGPAASPPGPPAVATPSASAPPGDAAEVLLRRHAPRLARQRLLAIEAEDHYVRFHTEGGSALVLMRLRDAVAALGPEAGWQPHRSFWLAIGVAARAERSGGGWTLTLPNGLVVPVSRANVVRLRAADYAADRVTPAPHGPASGPGSPW